MKECLDSILKQNIPENIFEIVCVDDGSKDSSANILSAYAEKYSNIRVFHKENGGVSSARNLGVMKALGKWIWFVDADDYIADQCVATLLTCVEKNEVDFCVFSGKAVTSYQPQSFSIENSRTIFVEGQKEVLGISPKRAYANGPVYYFFKKEIIVSNGIFFDETMKYGEDTKFVFEYKFCCRKAVLVDEIVYFYRQNPQSAMGNLNAVAHAKCMWKLAELYNEYINRTEDKELKQRFEVARCRSVRAMLFDNCIYIRDYNEAKRAFANAKEKGWIPFDVKLGVYSKSFKGILINLFNELLEIRWIYLLLCRIFAKKRKNK